MFKTLLKPIIALLVHFVIGEKQISRYVLKDEINALENKIKEQKAVIEKQKFMLWHYESITHGRKA